MLKCASPFIWERHNLSPSGNGTLTRDLIGYLPVASDPVQDEVERVNQQAPVKLLRESGEQCVEMYGVWVDSSASIAMLENVREELSLPDLEKHDFRFKERGFYRLSL